MAAFDTGEVQDDLDEHPALWQDRVLLDEDFFRARRHWTPTHIRDVIQKREGRKFTFEELSARLKTDYAQVAHNRELLKLASNAVIKERVDGRLIALGGQSSDEVPLKDFAQDDSVITWHDTIEAGGRQLWQSVRFRHSEIMALWPASAPPNGSDDKHAKPIAKDRDTPHVAADVPSGEMRAWYEVWLRDHPGASDTEVDVALPAKFKDERFTREMLRNLINPDKVPRRRGRKPGKTEEEHHRRMRQIAN
jgi:hypothetical protein